MPVTENIAIPGLGFMFLRDVDSDCKAKDQENYEQRDADTVSVKVMNGFEDWRNVVYSVSRKGEKSHNCKPSTSCNVHRIKITDSLTPIHFLGILIMRFFPKH